MKMNKNELVNENKNILGRRKLKAGALSVLSFTITLIGSAVVAQKEIRSAKVNLEDVKIKGEVNNEKFLISNRERYSMNRRIKLRTEFRNQIYGNVPQGFALKATP